MVLVATAIAAIALLLPAAPASAATTAVHYRHLTLHVPAAWPVYRLAGRPSTCVRFDRHAVYLGRPSPEQRCPNRAIGQAASALVEPIRGDGTAGEALAAKAPSQSAIARPAASRVRIVAGGPRAVRTTRRLLGRSIPRRKAGRDRTLGPAPQARSLAPAAATGGTTFKGLGFDTCSAPSSGAMNAWKASPYRAVGIYLGGVNSACVQPNLTPTWVRAETAAGWHLIPIYVGLQAPSVACGCATIAPSRASAQGASAAADAVGRAEALGIGPGSPIYFDMEGYTRGSSSSVVRAFLAGWTNALHASGYRSGVYSSGASGIVDLVAAADTTYKEPDDIWVANWNGKATTTDPYLPASLWTDHQRVHQYRGGHVERYGGVSISIDNDALDADTVGVGSGDVGGGGGGEGGEAPAFANQLSFIKTRHTGGKVEVHLDSLEGASFRRSLDATSDFPTAAGRYGHWQLFGRANGAPELGFIKEGHAHGTVQVQWDTLQNGTYHRAGSATSDFRPADGKNGRWQLFGGSHGVPKLGFIKLRHSPGKRVGVRWDVLRGGSYHRTGIFSSDFHTAARENGRWQLFGGARGAPKLGFIKLRHARRRVTVHWDSLRRGSYRRAGDFRTEFGTHAGRNGVWQLIDVGARAPELGFVKLRSTRGSVEGHWELLQGSSFKEAGDADSDFSLTQAERGFWQLSPF
jgi:hypothetical protein